MFGFILWKRQVVALWKGMPGERVDGLMVGNGLWGIGVSAGILALTYWSLSAVHWGWIEGGVSAGQKRVLHQASPYRNIRAVLTFYILIFSPAFHFIEHQREMENSLHNYNTAIGDWLMWPNCFVAEHNLVYMCVHAVNVIFNKEARGMEAILWIGCPLQWPITVRKVLQ